MNNFIANPFQMLATDKLIVAVPDGNGLSPLLQYPAMAIHPPMLYLGYVGFAVPFAFAIGIADHAAAGRGLDPHHAPLDAGDVAVPKLRHHAGRGVGVPRAGLGRILGLGPGGERVAAAVAERDGVSALGDDAGKEGHDEGLEHRAGFGHLLPVHSGDVPDALGRGAIGACVRAVGHRQIFRQLPGAGNRGHHLPDSGPAGLPEERSAAGIGDFARIELPV